MHQKLVVPELIQLRHIIFIQHRNINGQKRLRIHNILVGQIGKKSPFPAVGNRANGYFRRGIEVTRQLRTMIGQIFGI